MEEDLVTQARLEALGVLAGGAIMSRFGDYGFAGTLPKPYRLKDLKGKLAEVLRPGV